jgi:ParB-like chromosome segregation protein Spo0J
VDADNARKHGARNLRSIAASLKRFGQAVPLLVQEGTNVVLAGNGTMRAMIALGWEECTVVYTDKTGKDARALALALNRSAELAEWDADALADQLREQLTEIDLEAFGWPMDEVHQMLLRDDDLPTFEDEADDEDAGLKYRLVIECEDEVHQGELLERLEAEGLSVEPLIS